MPEEFALRLPEYAKYLEAFAESYGNLIEEALKNGGLSKTLPPECRMKGKLLPSSSLLRSVALELGVKERLEAVKQGVPAQDAFA